MGNDLAEDIDDALAADYLDPSKYTRYEGTHKELWRVFNVGDTIVVGQEAFPGRVLVIEDITCDIVDGCVRVDSRTNRLCWPIRLRPAPIDEYDRTLLAVFIPVKDKTLTPSHN